MREIFLLFHCWLFCIKETPHICPGITGFEYFCILAAKHLRKSSYLCWKILPQLSPASFLGATESMETDAATSLLHMISFEGNCHRSTTYGIREGKEVIPWAQGWTLLAELCPPWNRCCVWQVDFTHSITLSSGTKTTPAEAELTPARWLAAWGAL